MNRSLISVKGFIIIFTFIVKLKNYNIVKKELITSETKVFKIKSFIKLHPILTLLLLATFFSIFRLGAYDLREWDEPYYASRALAIIENGEWLDQSQSAPGGLWTGAHPPLTIWMMTLSLKMFGSNEWGLRLPIAICGIIVVILLYLFVSLLTKNKDVAFISSFILVITSYFIRYTRMSQLDIPVLMWILLSLFFFYKGTIGPKLNYVLAGIFFGLSLLSKIIVGFLSPMIIFLYLIWEYFVGSKNKIKQKIIGFSIFIFSGLIIALPWFIAITGKLGFNYWEQALGYHVFSRIGSALETHSSPLGIIYWPHQIVLRLNVFFPFLIFGMFSLRKSKFMDSSGKILLWSWLLIPFTIFTFVSTKFHTYILTFIIPLVIFCAIGVYHYFNSEPSVKTTVFIIITSFSSLIWMQTHSFHRIFEQIILSTRRLTFPELKDILIFFVFILGVFVAYYFLYRYLNNRRKKDYLKIVSICFIYLVLFPAIVKNFEPLIQKGEDWIDLRSGLTQEEIPVRKLIFNGEENGVNIFNMQLLSYTLDASYENKSESIGDLIELENTISQLVKHEILIIEKSRLKDFKGEVENLAFIQNDRFLIITFSPN
jgi:hypothetical protein